MDNDPLFDLDPGDASFFGAQDHEQFLEPLENLGNSVDGHNPFDPGESIATQFVADDLFVGDPDDCVATKIYEPIPPGFLT